MAGFDLLVRFARFGQRKSLRNDRRHLSRFDQFGQFFENFRIRMRAHSRTGDAVLGAFSLVRLVCDRNDAASFFHDTIRARQNVGAAHAIEHKIDVLDHVLELRRGVINRLIDPELLQRILVLR